MQLRAGGGGVVKNVDFLRAHYMDGPLLADLTLLGAPIGVEATPVILRNKVRALKDLCKRLHLLLPHQAFFLLKNAFALPKLMYSLRSGPCFLCDDILHEFDHIIWITLQRIANIQLNATMMTQMTLTTKMGGFGVLSAVDLAPAAFLASRTLVFELATEIRGRPLDINLHSTASTAWQKQVPPDQPVINSQRQKDWFRPVLAAKRDALLAAARMMMPASRAFTALLALVLERG